MKSIMRLIILIQQNNKTNNQGDDDMNVMVYNKYKELLMGLNLDIMKSIEGVFNVDEIIDTFSNYYYDKMILDITAIRDYQNADNIQK